MARRLSEDEIKYTVSAETAKAQQEIRNLTKATSSLRKEEKERRNAMVELEAQGKKNTTEYRNLETEAKKLSKQISDNNKEIQKLTKGMNVNDMTMTQLKKHAKELERQLDNTAESANPEEYTKLNQRLADVRDRMKQLRTSGLEVNKQMDQSTTIMNKLKMAAKAFIAVKVVGWLKSAHDQAYNTRKEFAKYEAVLRNTFQSQEKANDAMKMLQQLAADTPSSLQEWTEGYIKLVNRGLQPTSQELTNLGDLAASQGKSLDQLIEAVLDAMTGENERLKEFGIKASKEGEKTQFTFRGVTTEVRNSEDAIKDYLLSLGRLEGVAGSMAVQMNELEGIQSNLGDTMDAFFNNIGKKLEPFWKRILKKANEFVGDLSATMEPLTDTYEKQLQKVTDLESQLPQMTSRYEDLYGKLNRSKEEQQELNDLISKISSIVPSAISDWNAYGDAIAINTDKVKEYIEAEKARLNFIHREQIANLNSLIPKLQAEKDALEAQAKRGTVWAGGASGITRKMTTKELEELNTKIKQLGKDIEGAQAQLDMLTGNSADKMVKDRIEAQKEMAKKREEFNAMNKKQLDSWIKDEKNAASQYLEIAKEIYNKRFPSVSGNDDKNNKKNDKNKPPKVTMLTDAEMEAVELSREMEAEKQMYAQQQLELKELFASGRDENLQSEADYNEALEQLAIMHLQRMLEISGLSAEQRKEIESQLLDFKVKCMQEELENRERSEKESAQKEEENTRRMQEEYKKRVNTYVQYGQQIGDALGSVIAGQEDALQGFADTMIDIVFDVLGQIVQAEIIKATATATGAVARATAEAYATPDSVLTFGTSGTARAAVLSGLIMAALAAAKSTLKGLINKSKSNDETSTTSSQTTYNRVATGLQSGGSIDVVRSQDGKLFPQTIYDPDKRGYIDRPTVIVGEGPAGQSREWVASNAAVSNPTVAPILDIIDRSQQAGTIRTLDLNNIIKARMAGFSSGGNISRTSATSIPNTQSGTIGLDNTLVSRLISAIERLEHEGIPADVVLTDLERKQKQRDRSRKIGSK